MNSQNIIEKPPIFPAILSAPLKILPLKYHSKILVTFLNRLLKEQIDEGELDFLEHKTLCVTVSDAGLSYYISLRNNALIAKSPNSKKDIDLQACIYDYIQLIARKQDPDTLVFQRRLVMQGNTELGLELKNFLDGLDLESNRNFSKIEYLLEKSLPVYQRIFR